MGGNQFVLQWPQCPLGYVVAAIALSVLVRVCVSALRAIEEWRKARVHSGYLRVFRAVFHGHDGDHYHSFFVGLLEALTFPILLVAGQAGYVFVGAWFSLKTLAQASAWKSNRNTFQRFLIGNALIVIGTFFLSRCSSFFR